MRRNRKNTGSIRVQIGLIDLLNGFSEFPFLVDKELNEEQGSGGLPGVLPTGGEVDASLLCRGDQFNIVVLQGGMEVKAAMGKMICQRLDNLIENTRANPGGIVAIAGLMGGIFQGEIIPGGAGAQFPENGVEDAAGRLRGPAGTLAELLREEVVNCVPLVVGKVHILPE